MIGKYQPEPSVKPIVKPLWLLPKISFGTFAPRSMTGQTARRWTGQIVR